MATTSQPGSFTAPTWNRPGRTGQKEIREISLNLDPGAPTIDVSIDGVLVQGVQVDGGASVNLMNVDTMEELGFDQLIPTMVVLRMADSSRVRPMGTLRGIDTVVVGITYIIDYIVFRLQSTEYTEEELVVSKSKAVEARKVANEARTILEGCHLDSCGGHFKGDNPARKVLQAGYWWPTLFADAHQFTRRCDPCQRIGRPMGTSAMPLVLFLTQTPFEKWGIDFVGPIAPASRHGQKRTIEALTAKYEIKHRKTTPYHPRANGQTEKTNGILCTIITKTISGASTDWDTKLFAALWAYCTVYKVTTNATPFQLVYGQEAILPIEFKVQSLHIALEEQLGDTESLQVHFAQLEQLDETRTNALLRQEATQRRRKRKFHIWWHGPYRVIEGFPNGSVQLEDFMGAKFTTRINENRLRLYAT
ncbi:uncharacterized protein [Physcomitrium patens]|uniref:uncharacterized protein n=1 Tax=Physcomitrium patens TaxID=3218 RepID=UPI003CCDC8FC